MRKVGGCLGFCVNGFSFKYVNTAQYKRDIKTNFDIAVSNADLILNPHKTLQADFRYSANQIGINLG